MQDKKADIKKMVGEYAAQMVEDGMKVGLGTGSTAEYFIRALAERCHQGLDIGAVATSQESQNLAQELGIPLLDISEVFKLDMTVDGADEVDSEKRLIKGGGGALLREKIIATASHEMVVIIDESKHVDKLGAFGLPVEIVPFGLTMTLEKIPFPGSIRKNSDGTLFTTDNGNYIFDIVFKELVETPEEVHDLLINIPGVVETGLFIKVAGRVIKGDFSGEIEILK